MLRRGGGLSCCRRRKRALEKGSRDSDEKRWGNKFACCLRTLITICVLIRLRNMFFLFFFFEISGLCSKYVVFYPLVFIYHAL